jgi:hypothetical protein
MFARSKPAFAAMRRPAFILFTRLIPKGGKIGIAVLPRCFRSQKEKGPGAPYARKFLQ